MLCLFFDVDLCVASGCCQVLTHVREAQQLHRRRHDLREIRPGRFEQARSRKFLFLYSRCLTLFFNDAFFLFSRHDFVFLAPLVPLLINGGPTIWPACYMLRHFPVTGVTQKYYTWPELESVRGRNAFTVESCPSYRLYNRFADGSVWFRRPVGRQFLLDFVDYARSPATYGLVK